jgi:hypothetical protein
MDELMAEEELVELVEEERREKRKRTKRTVEEKIEKQERKKQRTNKEDVQVQIADETPDGVFGGSVDMEIEDAKEGLPAIRFKSKPAVDISSKVRRPPALTKPAPSYPCLFCPSQNTEDLLPVHELPDHLRSRHISNDPVVRAHESCALAMQEVYLEDMVEDGKTVTYVMGTSYILKDRWNLVRSSG